MAISEKKHIKSAQKGNVEAFEALISDHQKKVYNIALRMMKNKEDAEDMAQEVFVKAFKSLLKFKGDSTFSTWLYRITMNTCTDEIRKRKRMKTLSLNRTMQGSESEFGDQLEDAAPGPETITEVKDLNTAVRIAISMLPENHRRLIILRDFNSMDYKEISKILQIPTGTVKSGLSRARKALKKIIMEKTELFDEKFVKNSERRAGI